VKRSTCYVRLEEKGQRIAELSEPAAAIAENPTSRLMRPISSPSTHAPAATRTCAAGKASRGRRVEDIAPPAQDHPIRRDHGDQVVRALQEHGLLHLREGTAGVGHRPERRDRDGLPVGVVQRKMSGSSMSAEGARAYAYIQSIAMTCQLRGISFHRFLKARLICYIGTGRPMLLAEFESRLKPLAVAA